MTSNEIKESLERLLHGTSKDLSAYLLEVCSNETVQDTKTDLHVHMLRLDGNNRPRINDFANFVTDCIIDYCIPPSEIREAKERDEANHTTTHLVKLYKKAAGLFTDLNNTGEGGELLLSIMVQRILGIPQLLCKMPLKTNPNVHYHGADGIYGKFDETSGKFCLYWAESKLYSDLGQAMTDCFDSIKTLLIEEGGVGTQRERDLTLFRDNLDFDDVNLENAIVAYLNPDKEEYLSLEYRGVCLVGYDETAYPNDLSGIEAEIKEAIANRLQEFKNMVSTRLKNRLPLDDIVIDVLIVPFSDVNQFREKFLGVI